MSKRPILFFMIALGMSLFGFIFNSKISLVRLDQQVYPGLGIRIDAKGYDVNKIENEIVFPIERTIATVGGVKSVRSISEDGSAFIQIKMNNSFNLKEKSLEFREKIDLVSSKFPREVHKPQVFRYDPTNSPLMVISFSNNQISQDELRELVEKSFKRSLEAIEGVSQVIIGGGKIREIQVACDPKQLEGYGLSLKDIVSVIQDKNQNDALGKLSIVKESLSIQLKERFNNLLEIRDLPLKVTPDGRIIFLKDVAKISFSPREENIGARLNAEEKVTAFIYKNESSDIVAVSKEIRSLIKKKNIANLKVEFNQDESKILTETIKYLLYLELLILISLSMYFISIKKYNLYFVIYVISLIPVFFGFLLLYGFFFRSISLATCYGLIFGNLFWILIRARSFVISESNRLKVKENNHLNLLMLNLLCSVILSKFLSNEVSKFFTILLFSSIVVCILLDFYFVIFIYNVKVQNLQKLIKFSDQRWMQYYKRSFEFISDKLFKTIAKTEESILSEKQILPLALIFFIFLGVYTFYKVQLSDSIESDKSDTVAFLEFPSGTSFPHTDEVSLKVEKSILKIPGVKQIVSKIDPAHTLLLIELDRGYLPDAEFIKTIKTGVGSTEDAFLFFAADQNSSFFQEISFDLIGNDQELLEILVSEIAEKVRSLDGVAELVLRYKSSRDELRLLPDPSLFQVSEVSLPHFGNELNLALQGGVATKFIDGEKEIDVRVRYAEEFRKSKLDFSEIRIKNLKDKFIPISTIVSIDEKKIPVKIYHKNRMRTLSFSVKLEGNSSNLKNKIKKFVTSYSLPTGYRLEEDSDYLEDFNSKSGLSKFMTLFLPFATFGASFLSLRKKEKIFSFLHKFYIPYLFSVFLIIFFYPGDLYLPFQISLLLMGPLAYFFISSKYHLTKSIWIYLAIMNLCVLVFIDNTLISFFYIFIGVMIYLFVVFFGHQLEIKWSEKYEIPLLDFLRMNLYQFVSRIRIFVKR
ncbi:efflux RND transporter permease subunit [Leptospira bouyouniensis]|uniref:efflux RND transporter permease subunit n=1 Tax=Leptospira bouyouniensis TaxID=2484911 RepID=UPI001ABFB30D|nr:efflux RND transporter permease subunit [Leptospira bouyouniensis]